MSSLYSTIGLVCCFIPVTLHGIEVFLPLTGSRFVANYILPLFTGSLPKDLLQADDQEKALESLIEKFPSESWTNAANYLFLLIFEQKQGAVGFIAAAAGAVYGVSLPLVERHAIHLIFTVMSACMVVANANHATGLSFLGEHPFVSTAGRNVGLAFVPFWLVSTYCNFVAFGQSKEALSKMK